MKQILKFIPTLILFFAVLRQSAMLRRRLPLLLRLCD